MASDTSNSALQTIGNYDLLAKIAEGGMGTVYKGRHRLTGQIVAIKIVPPSVASNKVLLKRFEQEFRAASALDHPNIVRALDYDGTGSRPFLVMEYVDGESLGQRLEREGRIPEAEAIRLIVQVAQGLHKAHKEGLIHRDVKPDNILVTADGQAKLTDLGLVKDLDTELNLTRTGRGLGTPHFMAPEQFRNAKNADVRCDIYSLGATLYMMVTGELPFKSCGPLDAWMKKIRNDLPAPRQLVPELSERVDWAIRRAMSADPNQRPESCREFVEDLIGRSTRRSALPGEDAAALDLWYLVYTDDVGVQHTVKGSTEGIRRALREGHLGDASNVRACRTKAGPFEPLRQFPEFRDLLVAPAPLKPATATPPPPAPRPPETVSGSWVMPPSIKARPAESPPVASPSPAPRIELNEAESQPTWLMWCLLIVLAAASGAMASYLFFQR
ncbi:MAG: serine/threonine protein kinase [Gemmataceae bacterium]|nr:serine/threonine protein kinase [Gemmataceae bacterium]MDW8265202.1 serine/threonine-protein kinase [Gemmataceae bacterium]